MRRRKTVYPPPKTATKGTASGADPRTAAASRVVSIDVSAIRGRSGLVPGTRVEIGSGLYAGEVATVESAAGGVIPAVVVRTEAGRTRRVRAIDLVLRPERPGDAEGAKSP
jgi:hypothetical protein